MVLIVAPMANYGLVGRVAKTLSDILTRYAALPTEAFVPVHLHVFFFCYYYYHYFFSLGYLDGTAGSQLNNS